MRRQCQAGVTLIELVIAITIVAIGVTSILGALAAASSHSADAMVQQQAVSVAQAYLDEILQRWVVDPTGTPVASGRANWNTVDAYNGWPTLALTISSATPSQHCRPITSRWQSCHRARWAALAQRRCGGST